MLIQTSRLNAIMHRPCHYKYTTNNYFQHLHGRTTLVAGCSVQVRIVILLGSRGLVQGTGLPSTFYQVLLKVLPA